MPILGYVDVSFHGYCWNSHIVSSIRTTKYKLKGMDDEARAEGVRKQLDLFWFGDPKFVVTITQFMQFGFSLSGAVVRLLFSFFFKSVQTKSYISLFC